MKKNILFCNLALLSLLIVASACMLQKKINKNILYKVTIEDIECPLCAQVAIDVLKKIDGVTSAEFFDNQGDYETGYALIESKDNQIPKEAIIKQCLQYEGFDLKEISC